MEKQFLPYFVSMHLFLNKIVYRKECKQFVIWPVVLTAPRGRVECAFSKNDVGKPEGASLASNVSCVCH